MSIVITGINLARVRILAIAMGISLIPPMPTTTDGLKNKGKEKFND
jgi:hypothetical protein